MEQLTVEDLLSDRRVSIVDVSLPLHAALKMLEAPGVETLLVLSHTGPCGVLRRAALSGLPPSEVGVPVAANMTLVGPAIPADMDARQALNVMRGCARNDLPVMDTSGKVVSLITMPDLLVEHVSSHCADLVA